MFSDRTNWKLTRNRLTEALEEVRATGADVLDLTLSNPTRAGLRYDEALILQSLASPQAMDYDPQPNGLLTAREAVAAYYRREHEVDLDPEQLVLTTSTSEGYSFVFRLLCNPGDELLVPKPSYPLFEFLADLQDVKLVPYPLIYDHGWQMDFPSLQKAVTKRTRGVVVVHPNNPTGSFVHPHEKEALNRFCHEHSFALIADEVFLDYAHDRVAGQQSFASNQNVLTFTLSGVSKISALPQMKVAWIAVSGPPAELDPALARLEVIADTYLSMNAPIQWAARPCSISARVFSSNCSTAYLAIWPHLIAGLPDRNFPAFARGRRMVRGASCPGHADRRRIGGCSATAKIRAGASRTLL